jgi:hypothetical protein
MMFRDPTQAKSWLEWGTQQLLPVGCEPFAFTAPLR